MTKILIGEEFSPGQLYAVFDGIAYQPHGYFGCQIQSIERKKPKIGDRRILQTLDYYHEFEIFSVNRLGFFTYECNWALPKNCNTDEYVKRMWKMWTDIFNHA